jgi:Raf kinase inhibitor-like YbhB/YbcL family protein
MPGRLTAVLVAIVALLALACGDGDDDRAVEPTVTLEDLPSAATETAVPGAMSLTSTAFADNGPMPVQYTCDGDNISPPLAIDGAPEGTAALALMVIDIDVPGRDGFVHWAVANISPAADEVPEGTVPIGGVEGPTSRGQPGYFGPCPPSGTHRYVFTLYALDAPLAIDGETGAFVDPASTPDSVLASATLTGTYAR